MWDLKTSALIWHWIGQRGGAARMQNSTLIQLDFCVKSKEIHKLKKVVPQNEQGRRAEASIGT